MFSPASPFLISSSTPQAETNSSTKDSIEAGPKLGLTEMISVPLRANLRAHSPIVSVIIWVVFGLMILMRIWVSSGYAPRARRSEAVAASSTVRSGLSATA